MLNAYLRLNERHEHEAPVRARSHARGRLATALRAHACTAERIRRNRRNQISINRCPLIYFLLILCFGALSQNGIIWLASIRKVEMYGHRSSLAIITIE
jgi:hypothetical protein